jgi:hypothetical protein
VTNSPAGRSISRVCGTSRAPKRETVGSLALLLVHQARRDTRTDAAGRLHRQDEQVAAISASSAVQPAVFHLIYRSGCPLTAGSRGSTRRLSRSGQPFTAAPRANSPVRTHWDLGAVPSDKREARPCRATRRVPGRTCPPGAHRGTGRPWRGTVPLHRAAVRPSGGDAARPRCHG